MPSLLAPEHAISMYRGSSKTLELFVTDEEHDKPVNLTGATLYFTVRRTLDDDAPLMFKTTAVITQIALTKPLAGVAEIYIQPSDTARMAPGLYVFDVWVALASGNVYCIVEPSSFELKKGVTRF